MSNVSTYNKLFSCLDGVAEEFIAQVNMQKLGNLATGEWTVKDVLRHVVYWHRYYAQQYRALTENKTPYIFPSKGGSTRNQDGVDSLKRFSKKDLLKMFHQAHTSMRKSILDKQIPGMNYTDRKYYTTEEFLNIVTHHISSHTKQVRKAKPQQ